MNKAYWLQPETTQLGDWQNQIRTLTGSESFCVLPWIHLATRPNGDMRICCVANASGADSGDYTVGLVKREDGRPSNFGSDLPSTAFNSDYMRSVRKTMLAGEAPASCKKCYDEEAEGIVSKRIWETGTWHKGGTDIPALIQQTEADGTIPFKLSYLDLRLGNTCNLKCIMCSPHDSSKWLEDHVKVFPMFESRLIKKQMAWDDSQFNNHWHESPDFWREVFEQIPNITELYFAGGEPLMIKEHRRFLEEIVAQGRAGQVSLRYNTNLTLLDEGIIELWTRFKRVKVGCSIDAIGERAHYIRYPTDWATVEKNLRRLDATPDNIEVNIALAVQILNIKHVPDFIKWKVTSKFQKVNMSLNAAGQLMGGGLVGVHLLWIPTWLSLRVLPAQDKLDIRNRFADLQQWLWDNYTQEAEFWEKNPYGWARWEGILDWMDAEDHTNLLPDFCEYIEKMDARRGLDFKQVFPELAHLL